MDIKEFSNKFVKNYVPMSKKSNTRIHQAYNMMHKNIRNFESKEKRFERVPGKRHSSYEDRAKSDSVSKRNDVRLFVTQRNCNSTHKQSHDKNQTTFYNPNDYSFNRTTTLESVKDIVGRRGNNHSTIQENIQRMSTAAGCNRHLQPRQNPLVGSSPRTTQKIHLTPSEKRNRK